MTMTRRQIREEIFKIIFQADFHNEDEMKEQVNLFLQDEKMQEAETEFPVKSDQEIEQQQYIAEKSRRICCKYRKGPCHRLPSIHPYL